MAQLHSLWGELVLNDWNDWNFWNDWNYFFEA